MIINPIKAFRLKQEAERNKWLKNWVRACLDDPNISFVGKIQLLGGYYDLTAPTDNKGDKDD